MCSKARRLLTCVAIVENGPGMDGSSARNRLSSALAVRFFHAQLLSGLRKSI